MSFSSLELDPDSHLEAGGLPPTAEKHGLTLGSWESALREVRLPKKTPSPSRDSDPERLNHCVRLWEGNCWSGMHTAC